VHGSGQVVVDGFALVDEVGDRGCLLIQWSG